MYMYQVEEVLNDIDKTFGVGKTESPSSNKLSVTVAAVPNKKHYIGSIVLTGTAGTGANETLAIKKGTTTVWQEGFSIGTDKVRQFQAIPLVGDEGEAVTVEASADNLTAGKLYVVYFTK